MLKSSNKAKINWFPLLATNFLGILNDNFLKKAVSFISIYWIADGNENQIIAIAGGLFIVPYIILSPYAGYLAKAHLKRKIVVYAKLAEIPIMAIAAAGFLTDSLYLVMAAIFLMGLQSCLFSPAKYGLVRDTGGKKLISFGLGAMEMLSFLGNLFGAVLAGIISDLTENRNLFIIMLFFVFSLTGWLTSRKINPKESDPKDKAKGSLNPIIFLYKSIKWSKNVKGLNYVVFGLGFFWLAAAMIEMNIINYCPNYLKISFTETGYIMAGVAVSVALGSLISGLLANKKVELSLTILGGLGFGINISLIYILNPGLIVFIVLICLAAFFAGIYKIPLNSFLQERVEGRKLGDIIAYNNLVVFIFILFAAGFIFAVPDPNIVFLIIGIIVWIMTAGLFIFVPEIRTRIKKILNKCTPG